MVIGLDADQRRISDVHSVAFSPEGTHISTASLDGTAKVWAVDAAAR